ncbi:hypothetical protein PPERSA_13076 [Pseudocohnilembus persalinus]|uniref:Uncharacterized protein n=1 Tax=Pseudocohnilembus persalinus TaxID=266149 RepID=A0A0V0QXI5_PSEPJ|nr:hypothetical protein PPERSA_13076 [Pseudocohnilembus persalinus]|eukprot:KRX06597.1 hypothetical protein PPERSA_13076 [Pseudocohnilembus persalinus]
MNLNQEKDQYILKKTNNQHINPSKKQYYNAWYMDKQHWCKEKITQNTIKKINQNNIRVPLALQDLQITEKDRQNYKQLMQQSADDQQQQYKSFQKLTSKQSMSLSSIQQNPIFVKKQSKQFNYNTHASPSQIDKLQYQKQIVDNSSFSQNSSLSSSFNLNNQETISQSIILENQFDEDEINSQISENLEQNSQIDSQKPILIKDINQQSLKMIQKEKQKIITQELLKKITNKSTFHSQRSIQSQQQNSPTQKLISKFSIAQKTSNFNQQIKEKNQSIIFQSKSFNALQKSLNISLDQMQKIVKKQSIFNLG